MKKIFLAVVLILLLTGCGEKEESFSFNSLELTGEGALTAWSVADFNKDYLDLGEFTKEAKTAIKSYNETAGEDRIALKDVSEQDGSLTVQITYMSAADYQTFNSVLLSQGSLKDLVRQEKGIDESAYYYDPSGTLRTTLAEILDLEGAEDWKYLAVGEPLRISLPGKVRFMSYGAYVDVDGWVNTGADMPDRILLDAPCYIIYEEN